MVANDLLGSNVLKKLWKMWVGGSGSPCKVYLLMREASSEKLSVKFVIHFKIIKALQSP